MDNKDKQPYLKNRCLKTYKLVTVDEGIVLGEDLTKEMAEGLAEKIKSYSGLVVKVSEVGQPGL